MVVSGCKAPSSVANLVKDSRKAKGGPPLKMRLSFTRFATELGALQPLTTTYNLLTSPYKPLTNIYIQTQSQVISFFSHFFTFCVNLIVLASFR